MNLSSFDSRRSKYFGLMYRDSFVHCGFDIVCMAERLSIWKGIGDTMVIFMCSRMIEAHLVLSKLLEAATISAKVADFGMVFVREECHSQQQSLMSSSNPMTERPVSGSQL
jgi:hypothetical protein